MSASATADGLARIDDAPVIARAGLARGARRAVTLELANAVGADEALVARDAQARIDAVAGASPLRLLATQARALQPDGQPQPPVSLAFVVRDNWRQRLHDLCLPLVKDCKTAALANAWLRA